MLSLSRGIGNVFSRIVFSGKGASLPLARSLQTTSILCCEKNEEQPADSEPPRENVIAELRKKRDLTEKELKLLEKDRSQKIPVETSISYLQSSAYKQTYGDKFVWEQYRRNHKGMFPPRKTRKTCVRKGTISTGNPCPICRDEYLVLDHRNIELLKQFISPHSGEVLSYSKTGLCQRKHLRLVVAVERARDYGLITYDVPYRQFDYSEFYGQQFKAEN